MGTNYYLHCACCRQQRHIGKSSFGWCFSLHVYPDVKIHGLDDWRPLFAMPGARIVDEYDHDPISPDEMLRIITERAYARLSRDPPRVGDYEAVIGPNNCWRYPIGRYCIGHGAGTWDLMIGEFS